jgi:hypothetical protein
MQLASAPPQNVLKKAVSAQPDSPDAEANATTVLSIITGPSLHVSPACVFNVLANPRIETGFRVSVTLLSSPSFSGQLER